MLPPHKLTPAEAAVLETFVVPRYVEKFARLALDAFLIGQSARVAHLGCRTGYPDRQLINKVADCAVFGVDPSLAAIELARNKAATMVDSTLQYQVGLPEDSRLPSAVFSHALTLHPIADKPRRLRIFKEMDRLLYSGGQVIVALPLSGSFQELQDLLREYALRFEDVEFGAEVERSSQEQPSVDNISEELETVGFDDVYVAVATAELEFESGRAFIEDPATRLLIFPTVRGEPDHPSWNNAIAYVQDAINKYWSETNFMLTLNIGCASCRKR